MKIQVLINLCVFLLFNVNSFSQTLGFIDSSAPQKTIENINSDKAIQIIEAVLKTTDFTLGQFDRTNKILTTDYFEWTSIAITNHARLRFDAKDDKLTISMVERQYKTDKGWEDTPTKLSKKNQKKYLDNLAAQISEASINEEFVNKALYDSELIKMFRPVVKIDDLEFKFIKGQKDVAGKDVDGNSFEVPNYIVEVEVTNTASAEVSFVLRTMRFKKNDGGYFNSLIPVKTSEWDHVSTKHHGILPTVTLGAGETRTFYSYYVIKDFEYLPNDIVPVVHVAVGYPKDSNKHSVDNYNMKIPFNNSL